MKQLTWFELSCLANETEVEVDGAPATILFNALNELSCNLAIRLENGEDVIFGGNLDPGANCHVPKAERDERANAWFELSPVAVSDEVLAASRVWTPCEFCGGAHDEGAHKR